MKPVPPSKDLPLYEQHTNGCGLAALLMLVNPPKNPEIVTFLDSIWDHIGGMFDDSRFKKKELKWAIVLQYLLLKALGYAQKEKLYQFFNERLEFVYEDQRIMNKFTHEQHYNTLLRNKKLVEAFTYLHYTEDHDYVTPILLFQNLHTMKTDLELKVLAEIFNYEFLYQESEDYTGAIYFTNKELGREIAQTARVKWNRLENLAQDPNNIILYGQQHHWLAIRGIYKTSKTTDISQEVLEEIQKKPRNNQKVKETSPSSPNQSAKLENEVQDSQSRTNIKNKSPKNRQNSPEKSHANSILEEITAIFEDETPEWHVKRMILDINDSALVSEVKMPYNQLNESDRFYVFRKRQTEGYPAFSLFLETLKEDYDAEKFRWNDYLKKRESSFEQKVNERAEEIKAKGSNS